MSELAVKEEQIELEIDLEKELEDYNELLKKCKITIDKIKKRRKGGRKSSIDKQE